MLAAASYPCKVDAGFLNHAIRFPTPDTPPCESIPVVEGIDYDTFWREYMYPNKPVIIRGLTEGWRALEWIRDGKPDFARLRRDFGDDEVCVAICGRQHFSDQARARPPASSRRAPRFARRLSAPRRGRAEGDAHALLCCLAAGPFHSPSVNSHQPARPQVRETMRMGDFLACWESGARAHTSPLL